MELNDTLLDFWIAKGYNGLIEGRRGTAKTAKVTAAFIRAFGDEWLYYSAPTMDPWVDIVGVPKEKTDENGVTYLDLVRPKAFALDKVQAIFLDELNRAKPKVIDAVMELIQFKSINGKKFPNLKVVFAAINPKKHDGDDNEEYAVEELDPAHKDRFHVYCVTEYKCDEKYFKDKYDEVGEIGVSWWNKLPIEARNVVSPRRLDYALQMYLDEGDIAYVLPESVSPSQLISQLKAGISYIKKLTQLYKENDAVKIKKELRNENFFNGVKEEILKNKDYLRVFAPLFPSEKFCNYMISDPSFKDFILGSEETMKSGLENLLNISEAGKANPKIIQEIRNKLTGVGLYKQTPLEIVIDNHYNDLNSVWLGNEDKMMPFCGFIQNRPLNEVTTTNLVQTIVILAAVASSLSFVWLSIKMGLQNIKAEAERRGTTFEDLMKTAQADKHYQSFVKQVKIDEIIREKKLFEVTAPPTATPMAAAQYSGSGWSGSPGLEI